MLIDNAVEAQDTTNPWAIYSPDLVPGNFLGWDSQR